MRKLDKIITILKQSWRPLFINGLILWIAAAAFSELAEDVWERETFAWDSQIAIGLHNLSAPWIDQLMLVITWTGFELVILFTVLVVGWFVWQREQRHALFTIIAVVGAVVISGLLKAIFQRPRPTIFTPLYEVTSYSFPSGHTLTAVGFYGFLAIVLWRSGKRSWGIAALLWAGLVGVSRVYLGVHYPSDVLASFAVGAIWLVIVAYQLGRTTRHPSEMFLR